MMSSYDPFLKPIQPIGPEDQEKIHPTAADELRIKDDGRGEIKIFIREEGQNLGPYFALIYFLKDALSLINTTELPLLKGAIRSDPLLPLLKRLHNQLKELTEINQSQNISYSLALTLIWNELLQQYSLAKSGKQTSTLPLDDVFSLIQQIQNYPQEAKYSLGYYLSEYAGKSWFPFPYIELLAKLHQDHIETPIHSHLQKWLNLLEKLV
ncbi:MAG: hypothetical protein KBC64_03540 [Simkaniaceae bacterium]|nr:hypothetical protein [Simkaniaceae bacterium]